MTHFVDQSTCLGFKFDEIGFFKVADDDLVARAVRKLGPCRCYMFLELRSMSIKAKTTSPCRDARMEGISPEAATPWIGRVRSTILSGHEIIGIDVVRFCDLAEMKRRTHQFQFLIPVCHCLLNFLDSGIIPLRNDHDIRD